MADPRSCGVTSRGSKSPTRRPRRITWMRVGQPDQLVEVGGDQQHREAVASGAPGCGPRSRPGRRRRRRGSGARRSAATGSPLISRPTMNFCWLPPESARAVVSMPGVRTSYASMIRSVSSRAPRAVDPAALARSAAGSGGRGCGSPRAARRAAARAAAGPRGCSRPRTRGGAGSPSRVMSLSPSMTTPLVVGEHADDGLDQLGLAVALDAGDAEHLAGVDGEVDVVEHARARSTSTTARSSTRSSGTVGDRRLLGARRRAARCRPSARRARAR